MNDEMTLEELADMLERGYIDTGEAAAALHSMHAAIRDRDELVSALAQERSARTYAENLLEDRDGELAALRKLRQDEPVLNTEWGAMCDRAEKAEVELAALRKRIDRFRASLPVGWWSGRLHAEWGADKESVFTREIEGKRVRLVVEDDDA